MGILNITPDSFFDGGKYLTSKQTITQIELMLSQGANIIDVGAFSSKPGSKLVSYTDEKQRLTPIFKEIAKKFENVIFSLDTFRSEIAKEFVNDYGVGIINDISAGELDANMFKTIAELNVPYIIMHMKGTPENMQNNPVYNKNIELEIIEYFAEKVAKLNQLGVNDIIIDPGFGFGKTLEQNYQLLNKLDSFKILDLPLLVGISRKSMITKLLNNNAENALNGTTILNTIAIQKAANILRVHDVKEAKEVIDILNFLQ
jgi:dihydropteroate synthase